VLTNEAMYTRKKKGIWGETFFGDTARKEKEGPGGKKKKEPNQKKRKNCADTRKMTSNQRGRGKGKEPRF